MAGPWAGEGKHLVVVGAVRLSVVLHYHAVVEEEAAVALAPERSEQLHSQERRQARGA